MADPLACFSAPTKAWFEGTFDAPTPVQSQGWEAISSDDHALLLAPTGSGKTLAAFLWTLDRLLNVPVPESDMSRCRVLYISPLKALTYDVQRNLRAPLAGIALEAERAGTALSPVRLATRTGDTSQSDRRDIARHPPDVLITTPESLYLMLTSAARAVLSSVEHVIVDEVHAVAGTKRGSHLALSLERLDMQIRRSGRRSPRRIGLSATQRPLDEIARFLGGRERDPVSGGWRPRPVTIVDAGARKALELEVIVPVEDLAAPTPPTPDTRPTIWPAVHPVLLDLIGEHRSTLIFVNTRSRAERLAGKLNELAERDLVRAHHGSVAREQRTEIEDALKAGTLPALVATGTLELGIDMGAIDLVVQVEAPTSVASGLQRVGRAGHQVGEPSRGKIFPRSRGDLVVAAVIAQRMQKALIEETSVPRNPLDVLAQHVVAMAAMDDVDVSDVMEIAQATYSFAELTTELLDSVLDMLSGRYPSDEFAELRPRVTWDRAEGVLRARPGARMLAVTSGGTIPDRGLFGVFTIEGGRVGELDEEMVYESRAGQNFVLGASTWRIEEITRDRVIVSPAPGEPGALPYWRAEGIGRPYELGRAVGAFLREIDDWSDVRLADECSLDRLAIQNLRRYVAEERKWTGGVIPTDRQIVVERFRDELGDWRICVLSPFGARVHAPWAIAIEAKIRERTGAEVNSIWTDDGIVLRLPEADEAPAVDSVILEPEEVEDLVTGAVGSSAMFAGRFRENAARALLLPRRRPGARTPLWQQRMKSANLLSVASNYGSFPILLETYRECLRDVFDLPALVSLMTDIRTRAVRVASIETALPSPFATSLAYSYVAAFYDEADAPLAERRAQALTLDRRMLAELVGSDELRELIDADALLALEAELQCLDEMRWARSPDEAHDLLRRLGDFTTVELDARAHSPGFGEVLVKERRATIVRIAGEDRLIAAEDAGRYRDGLGIRIAAGLPDAFLEPVADALTQLVRRWARTHGPFLAHEPADRLALPRERVEAVLAGLLDAGTVLHGAFRPEGRQREWCEAEVLRILRMRSLAALRKEVAPAERDALVRFLPAWHGIGSDARGTERLFEVITQLQGVAIPASVVERDVLAARVRDYRPPLLDELLSAGEVMWVGTAPLGRDDGKVMLLRRDNAGDLLARIGVGAEHPQGDEHYRLRELLVMRGACFFRELSGRDDKETLEALWDLVWAGEVTNDSFAAVRALQMGTRRPAGSRRARPASLRMSGPLRAQGRWSLVAREAGPGDPTVGAHALATALLERHGVLTREAVRGEGIPGGFSSVYAVLRAMEDAGRIRRGYFVAGLGGAQFALPGAVDRLRAYRQPGADNRPAVLLAATDPANPFGLTLQWQVKGAQRVAGAYVVFVEGVASLFVERGARGLLAMREFDGTWEAAAVGALDGLLADGRFARLALARYPHELEAELRAADFVRAPKGLVRYAAR